MIIFMPDAQHILTKSSCENRENKMEKIDIMKCFNSGYTFII
jgi:hypothetical protein